MAQKAYGTTPWGKEFLASIENETDTGRLGRGRSYANTGKIYDVIIKANRISAKVEGNYSPYYSTSLSFEPLPKGDKEVILEFIDTNPFVLADIMKGSLPKKLLDFVFENEINLFRGFKMGCNCFDFYGNYACKHIAALYFALTSEIDKNPFILFELRGIDLISHYNIKSTLEVPYPLELDFSNTQQEISPEEILLLKQAQQTSFILGLLDDNPPFCHIDYKDVLTQFYKKATKELPLVVSPIANEDIEKIQRVLQNCNITLNTKDDIAVAKFLLQSPLLSNPNNKKLLKPYIFNEGSDYVIIKPTALFNLFISFDDEFGSDSYKYLFYLFRVASILIENSGFIPSVAKVDHYISILYKPLLCVQTIKEQIEILSKSAPSIVSVNNKFLTPLSATTYILSAVLTDFVANLNFMHKQQKNNPPLLSLCFFRSKLLDTNKFEYKNSAYALSNYLGVFDLLSSNYRYKMFIEPSKAKHYLFYIKVWDKQNNQEYLLKEALRVGKKIEIIKFLSYLKMFLPSIESLLKNSTVEFSHQEIEDFLLATAVLISNLGVDVILPKELKNILKPRLVLKAKSKAKNFKSFFTLDGMLEYDWQVAIGDEFISIEEFEKLLQSGKELLQFKEYFLTISPQEAKAIFTQANQKRKLNTFEVLQASLSDEAFLDKNLSEYFEQIFMPKNIEVPLTLRANLREYQIKGFQWNVNNLLNGFGTILADDMGLGKTIQTITILLYLKENSFIKNNIVVVLPTSLLTNWEKELERFAPTLSFSSFYGSKRLFKEADIILTTYDILRRDLESFKKLKIDCFIIDEAQKIKNPYTNTTLAIKSIKAKYKIALSGTPVENNLSELWSIFDFSLPKYLKTLKEFTNNYSKDIEMHKDKQKIEQLKKITAPFMLRRLKTNKEIISDLPDKIIVDEYATMTKIQASLYQSVVNDTMEQIEENGTKGAILKLIVSLKQICNHPRNFDKSNKLLASSSGKTQLLLTLLDTIMIQDEKVLIFTQYTQMADILVELIQEQLLTTPLVLHGGMSKAQRETAVDLFQNDNRYKIFILSLKAGGVGLNLTAANHVIHYDLWFNPAVENQATDRAFRIGQTKKVTVHRLITKDSFEEKIDKMIKAKQELSDLSISIGENWLKDMDKDELRDIFTVNSRKI